MLQGIAMKKLMAEIEKADSSEKNSLKRLLGIQEEDQSIALDSIRRTRNLENRKQEKISFYERLPNPDGFREDTMIVHKDNNSGVPLYYMYIKRDRKWNRLGSTKINVFNTAPEEQRRGPSSSQIISGGIQSSYVSGWFSVSNNTTYTAGTSTGFAAYNLNIVPTLVSVYFSTTNDGSIVYPVTWDSVAAGVAMKITDSAISLRTGVSHITKYWDGSAFQTPTSGYLYITMI